MYNHSTNQPSNCKIIPIFFMSLLLKNCVKKFQLYINKVLSYPLPQINPGKVRFNIFSGYVGLT